MKSKYNFQDITLLITHYNRSSCLERLLARIQELGCQFSNTIISDDCSNEKHNERVQILKNIYGFQLLTTPENKGLAASLNRAQAAVSTPYTLYIQEDFVPTNEFPRGLSDASSIMQDHAEIDYIRFWAHYRFPTLRPMRNGFAETVYNPWNLNHLNFFMYSDNPHLRRSNFLKKFGLYEEEIDGDKAEHNMAIRFIQRKGKGLFYEKYDKLFEHKHMDEEISTFNRANWRSSRHPFFLALRALYLKYKCMKCIWQVNFT